MQQKQYNRTSVTGLYQAEAKMIIFAVTLTLFSIHIVLSQLHMCHIDLPLKHTTSNAL